MNYLICPICGFKGKNLKMHIRYKHSISLDTFKELYPDFGKTQVSQIPDTEFKCPFCNKVGIIKRETVYLMHLYN